MASLTGTKIKDTYDGLLKTTDNGGLGATAKQITDGLGTGSPIYVSTSGVGVGGSPTNAFDVIGESTVGNGTYGVKFSYSASNTSGIVDTANSANTLEFRISGSEAMRIDSSGNVLMNTEVSLVADSSTETGLSFDNARNLLHISRSNGNAAGFNRITNDGAVVNFHRSGTVVGSVSVTTTSTSYNTSSDYRLKENVVPMEGALDRIALLKPSRFNFISNPDVIVDGFLAHEVQEVIPEAATGSKDAMRDEEYEVSPAVYEEVVHPAELDEEGNIIKEEWTEQVLVSEAVMGTRSVPDYQGIDQSKIVPLLVGAIQELKAEIEALKAI